MKIYSLLACSVLLGVLASSCSYDPSGFAVWKSRQAVKQKLKSPGTAAFDTTRLAARADDEGLYIVYLEVDSQNAFGATVRSYALALMISNDQETVALHLEVQEDPISTGRVKELTREMGSGWKIEPWAS